MNSTLTPYVVALTAPSPLFVCQPYRNTEDPSLGWSANTSSLVGSQAGDVPYWTTRLKGASISLPFEGTGAYMCFTAGDASYDILLNGSTVEASSIRSAVGTPCKALGAQTAFVLDGLQPGAHNATIRVTSAPHNDFSFFGGGITLGVSTGGAGVNDSDVRDDQNMQWVLRPSRAPSVGWDTVTNSNFAGGTGTFDCNYSDQHTATYTFTDAVGVVLTGIVWKDSHAFSVVFDTEEIHNLDATGGLEWSNNRTVFFTKGNLDPDTLHQISIRNYNAEKPHCMTTDDMGRSLTKSRDCCVQFDSLTILKASTRGAKPMESANADSAVKEQPAKPKIAIGAIVGGTIVALLALAFLVLGAFVLVRRQRRHANRQVSPSKRHTLQLDRSPSILSTDATVTPYACGDIAASKSLEDQSELLPSKALPQKAPTASTLTGTGTDVQLHRDVIDRVLEYVASRIDPAPQRHGDAMPPQYSA
ncbi:hypothetical protein EXIGLDRAFT_841726 [Exidia glandulosa HHB12029]|uniref:Uncharacterized protein n=1 Tax=Exidia glandulosa HHB12029 TaxID=1314781 RepID=A0A165DPG9_EXIGL|nr:hypothetical protein EXIGLDRAFT_841726 [Exidia glandulosa HHB12029]